MSSVLFRRRRLGKGSTNGIKAAMQQPAYVVRSWIDNDVPAGADRNGFVFRWGCTSTLPEVLQHRTVVNSAASIHWCSDKRQGRLDMQEAGVSVPETWTTSEWKRRPQTYEGQNHWEKFVGRPARHAQGRNLVAGSYEEIYDRVFEDGYVSRLIDKAAEYRVFVCQGRAVWVARKTPGNPEDVAWNVARGGRFDNVRWEDWPLRVVKEAIRAHAVSGCDFSGVDVMVDAEGVPYVLEINSAPSQTSPYRQACVAKAFDWIVANGKAPIPLSDERGGWKKFAHPCLSEEVWK